MKTEAEVKALAAMHWRYVEKILRTHGEQESIIEKCRVHYLSALIHGWKHAKEDSGEAVFIPEGAAQTTVDGTKVAAEVFGYCQQA